MLLFVLWKIVCYRAGSCPLCILGIGTYRKNILVYSALGYQAKNYLDLLHVHGAINKTLLFLRLRIVSICSRWFVLILK